MSFLSSRTLGLAVALGLMLSASTAWAEAFIVVSTGLPWPGGKVQLFLNNGTYVRWDTQSWHADSGYPRLIDDRSWPGLGRYAEQIAASFPLDGSKVVFFLGRQYLVYDIVADRADPGYPRPIDERSWPGLAPYSGAIIGAMAWPGRRVQIFLNDGRYLRYDLTARRVEPNYPRRVDDQNWPGLGPYAQRISGMTNWPDGSAMIFLHDGLVLRYDIARDRVAQGFPQRMTKGTWPGLRDVLNFYP